jgi:hypothetical protein
LDKNLKKIWVHRAHSFKEAEEFDDNYYLSMSGKERLETMQLFREVFYKMKGNARNESGKGLRRVVKVIQQ